MRTLTFASFVHMIWAHASKKRQNPNPPVILSRVKDGKVERMR